MEEVHGPDVLVDKSLGHVPVDNINGIYKDTDDTTLNKEEVHAEVNFLSS